MKLDKNKDKRFFASSFIVSDFFQIDSSAARFVWKESYCL